MQSKRADTHRCDGCGTETRTATHYEDDDTHLGTYCPGCEMLRRRRDIEPGDHDQYRLTEAQR